MFKSPLPWVITMDGDVQAVDGRIIIHRDAVQRMDKRFLVHAVNVYPKFTYLLQDVIALPEHIEHFDLLASEVKLITFPAKRLLQEINRFDRLAKEPAAPDKEPP